MRRVLVLPFGADCPPSFTPDEEIDVTSRADSPLSPFFLGPGVASDLTFQNFENLWQYHKVYRHLGHVGEDGLPTTAWTTWLRTGAASEAAHRYPAGRSARPVYSYWKRKCLSYTVARKLIYVPGYSRLAWRTPYFQELLARYQKGARLLLRDFDAYYTPTNDWQRMVDDPHRKFGHGFVVAMMLERGQHHFRPYVI